MYLLQNHLLKAFIEIVKWSTSFGHNLTLTLLSNFEWGVIGMLCYFCESVCNFTTLKLIHACGPVEYS